MRLHYLCLPACLLILSLLVRPVFAAQPYTLHRIGSQFTAGTSHGINQAGDVAGESVFDAFVWLAGVHAQRFTEDPASGLTAYLGREFFALGVDNSGALLAWSLNIDDESECVRVDANGFHRLDSRPLGFVTQELHPTLGAANGQFAGYYQDDRSSVAQLLPFISQGDKLVPFSMAGWSQPSITAINSLGWIAGRGKHNGTLAGFLLRSQAPSDLGPFSPRLLNDQGNLVGTRDADGSVFVWIGNKSFTIAPLPGVAGTPVPTGINNLGAVVGNQGDVPFLWTPAGGTTSLQFAAGIDWQVLSVSGINDAGEIAADAKPPVGDRHPVKLTLPGSRP